MPVRKTSPRLPAAAVNEISLRDIEANPWQPRSKFDEEALEELADSIKEIGIIQPVTVRFSKMVNISLLPVNDDIVLPGRSDSKPFLLLSGKR